MANTLTDIQNKLIARAMPVLHKNCILASGKVVNTDFNAEAAQKGASVNVPLPPRATATAVTPSSTPLAPTNKTISTVAVPLDKWYLSDAFLTDKDAAEVAQNETFLPASFEAAMIALAEQMNSDIWATCYPGIYGYAGTAGTAPFNTANDPLPLPDVMKVLNQQLCPRTPRNVVLDFTAEAKLLGNEAFRRVDATGQTGVIREGQMGRFYGADFYSDNQVVQHTAGTITTGLITKAATVVAAGLKTFSGTTAASTGACALVVGDIIAIAGHTTTYALTAVATQASAATDVTIAVEPGLEIALAGSEAITVKASHRVNVCLNRQAIAFVNRPLMDTGGQTTTFQDPITGLFMRLETVRQHKQTAWQFDVLYGSKLVRPEYACRIAG